MKMAAEMLPFSMAYGRCLAYLVVCLFGIWNCNGVSTVSADCPTPPSINGANITSPVSPPFLEGAEIQYHCLIGYDEYASSRTWRCNGTHWVGGDLTCTERLCSFLDPPQNGYISNEPTYELGSYIHFSCDEGYSLEGSSKLRCRIDGWVESVPKCYVNYCEEFEGVANGTYFQEAVDGVLNDYGNVIRVTCDSGFVLVGSPQVTCGSNGKWSTTPMCQPSECAPYPVSNSACIAEAFRDGAAYYLYCVEDTDTVSATRVGPESALCMNKTWTDTTMTCYCSCQIELMTTGLTVHNVDDRGFLRHNETLDWSCSNGSIKRFNHDLTCNDGSIEQPECVKTRPITEHITTGAEEVTSTNYLLDLKEKTTETSDTNAATVGKSSRSTHGPRTTLEVILELTTKASPDMNRFNFNSHHTESSDSDASSSDSDDSSSYSSDSDDSSSDSDDSSSDSDDSSSDSDD